MFLAAKEYKNKPQTVIKLNKKLVIDKYANSITLTSMNSGNTYYDPNKYTKPQTRGLHTFQKIKDYQAPWITELVVEYGIPDISTVTMSVERWIAYRVNYEQPKFERLEHIWP